MSKWIKYCHNRELHFQLQQSCKLRYLETEFIFHFFSLRIGNSWWNKAVYPPELIYSDKRRMHRNKLFSFIWVSLYCTSEGFNLLICSNLFCNMKRNKKTTFFKRVKLPLCLLIHFLILPKRPCWCLRTPSAVPGLLKLQHQETLELSDR